MLQLPSNINRFRAQNRSRRKLPLPASSSVRVAQVSAAAISFDYVQLFCRDRWDELETFRPGVLVGSAADLRSLAELAERSILDLASIDHATFVLTACGDRPVSDICRVVLWQAFGVPVYELFVGPTGVLIACECETHEGWHVERGVTLSLVEGELMVEAPGLPDTPTGLGASIDTGICPCGRTGTRLTNIEALASRRGRRQLAATA